jgi:hypothetical protein
MPEDRNVLGEKLDACSIRPMTGFYRTGCCETGAEDAGAHVVCVEVTKEFLAFSKTAGMSLARRCRRWASRAEAGRSLVPLCHALEGGARCRHGTPRRAPGTYEEALEYVSLAALKAHALDLA